MCKIDIQWRQRQIRLHQPGGIRFGESFRRSVGGLIVRTHVHQAGGSGLFQCQRLRVIANRRIKPRIIPDDVTLIIFQIVQPRPVEKLSRAQRAGDRPFLDTLSPEGEGLGAAMGGPAAVVAVPAAAVGAPLNNGRFGGAQAAAAMRSAKLGPVEFQGSRGAIVGLLVSRACGSKSACRRCWASGVKAGAFRALAAIDVNGYVRPRADCGCGSRAGSRRARA